MEQELIDLSNLQMNKLDSVRKLLSFTSLICTYIWL